MSLSNNFPAVRPSLLLDFANTKTLDPRITFTRGSTGTFYDGKTVAKAEENLFLQSQTFNTTWGTGRSTVTANTEVAPDNTTTADTITSTDNTPLVFQAKPTSGSGILSCYIKKGTSDFAFMYVDNPSLSGNAAYFNINTGVVGSFAGAITSTSIVSVGNGWYRCIAVLSGVSGSNVGIGLCDADNNTNCTVGRTIHVWGAQLEQRSSVTAYTPTTTAPITNYIPALQTAGNNVPRFEHNPVTGESLGLEIEEQRTNLLTYSDDFSNAAWSKGNASITSNAVVAPDGTQTADVIVENTSNAQHGVSETNTLGNATYTLSCYVKSNGRNAWLNMSDNSTGDANIRFNLSNGGIYTTNISGSWTSASGTITPVGNNWYRVTLTATKGAGTAIIASIRTSSADVLSYTGDGFSGAFIWGAQLEAGSFATSYIPTVASQVTRSRDDASMTGTNFSSWYRADEGTIYGESTPTGQTNNGHVVFSFLGTSSNAIVSTQYLASPTVRPFIVSVNGVNEVLLSGSGTAVNKIAGAYKINDFASSINGATVLTDTSGILPIVDKAYIGNFGANLQQFTGTIRKLSYYPRRLTNAELVALTTI